MVQFPKEATTTKQTNI